MSEPSKAVFLSYARDDAGPARRIADALRAFGVEVWFDQNELRGGDTWDTKIRTQIRTCTLFVAVISQRTEERSEGYFRREWKLAIDRTHDMAQGRAFIVPVVIDETPEGSAAVPEEFMRYQWTRLAGGEPTPEFVMQVKRLLEPRKSASMTAPPMPMRPRPEAAVPAGREPIAPTAPSPGRRLPLILGGVAVVAVAAALYFGLRPVPSAPGTAAVPAPAVAPKGPAGPAAATAADRGKSIAVLPFTNMSEEKDSGFFADGIHEDILTNLALIRELRVVSRTSVMQYRATTKSVRQIGDELGVAYILEGSVRRSGNKVRVTGQLVNARTDEHVWARNYDRELTDVFSIQSALSTEIADALSAALSPQEKQLLGRRPTDNLAAYDAYVKARQLRQRSGSAEELATGNELLQRAVQLDPKFAAAWAELSASHAFAYFSDFDRTAGRLAKATAAAETALRLAPDAPEVIEKVGDYHYYGFRDYARATEQYQRLAVLRPNDAVVFGSLGLIHRRQGRWLNALAGLRRSVQLEPRNLRYLRSLSGTALAIRRYDEAIAAQRAVVDLSPDSLAERVQLPLVAFLASGASREGDELLAGLTPAQKSEPLAVYLEKLWLRAKGDWAGAIRLDGQQRYYDGFGEPHGSQDVAAAFVLAAHGDKAAARARAQDAVTDLKAQLEQQPSNATTWSSLGGAYVILGDKAEALRCAEKATELLPEAKDALAGPTLSLNRASYLAWLGEKDEALAELARLLRTPAGENVHAARQGYTWFPLRGDPRFEALLNDPKHNAPLF